MTASEDTEVPPGPPEDVEWKPHYSRAVQCGWCEDWVAGMTRVDLRLRLLWHQWRKHRDRIFLGTEVADQLDTIKNHLPRELYVYRKHGKALIVRDSETGVELYTPTGTTRSPVEMAEYDGPVLVGGVFRRVRDEDGVLVAYHPYGGRMNILHRDDHDDEAVLLEEVTPVA